MIHQASLLVWAYSQDQRPCRWCALDLAADAWQQVHTAHHIDDVQHDDEASEEDAPDASKWAAGRVWQQLHGRWRQHQIQGHDGALQQAESWVQVLLHCYHPGRLSIALVCHRAPVSCLAGDGCGHVTTQAPTGVIHLLACARLDRPSMMVMMIMMMPECHIAACIPGGGLYSFDGAFVKFSPLPKPLLGDGYEKQAEHKPYGKVQHGDGQVYHEDWPFE
jgi:hypothetical protein